MSDRRFKQSEPREQVEREFTKRDWEALYFVMRLQEQVAMHGAPALHTFLAAMRETKPCR